MKKPRHHRTFKGWLAGWLQRRRRARQQPPPPLPEPEIILTSDGHGRLAWTLNFTTPYGLINIYHAADGMPWGASPYDGADLADGQRDCSGVAGYFKVCVCDWDGIDQPPLSNSVYSDGL